MNREIKFRGKRIDNDEWVYGYFTEWFFGEERRCAIIEGTATACIIPVIPETVGQWTGKKDKDSKEIYEGDKCVSDFGTHKPTEIKFGEFKDCTQKEQDNSTNVGFYWDEGIGECSPFGKSINGNMNYVKVIGNIHENKDLIKTA